MLIVTARPARSGLLLASLAGIVFLGGLARLMSWAIFGLPSGLLVLSMVCELVIPPLLIVWRGWIVRSRQLRSDAVAAAQHQGSQPTQSSPAQQHPAAQPPHRGSAASQQRPPAPPAASPHGRPDGPGQPGHPGQS
jgi:predicted lipid-binding transport protein (Tim44 family)